VRSSRGLLSSRRGVGAVRVDSRLDAGRLTPAAAPGGLELLEGVPVAGEPPALFGVPGPLVCPPRRHTPTATATLRERHDMAPWGLDAP
jgi:hypothetical protein